ncbi:YkoP family protein [Bacillus atrophaeus]|uniref:YkoP family protein n=1 Tax=Bacillus atrophaeus TaxID=1452 RepID=UPI00227EE0C8|nr:hypothetical protein [Bacillus atrophaeus]MCY8838146.1 hypothetical protein [Bacillus atrophaeus]MEC5219475.1 hypothetical protein [Bacillus atrophaeus]MED4579145.1 hypothetical protein [Bacillus atrophaeus]MED4720272.1 hypothetical protein [Bacillus atrophaeus]MED4847741.1 hypothetical protein [Bacillus atrophaeus]
MRNCFLSIWGIIDPIYYFFSRLTVIGKEKQSVFRVRLTRYKGAQIILSDGTKIKKNDVLVKIHLHNIKLMRELQTIESAVRKGMIIYQKVYISMPLLVDYISKHKKRDDIKGIIGITMLHKGVERLGFEVVKPSNHFYRFFKKVTHLPILYLTSKQFNAQSIPNSYYLLISKEKLQQKYQKRG